MNRRELIKSIGVIPLIPYIGTKYKTPPNEEIFDRLINDQWIEYPFDEFKVGDIAKRRRDNIKFEIHRIYSDMGPIHPRAWAVDII